MLPLVFLNKGFMFQPDVCIGCHDVLMISINLTGIAILKFAALIIIDYKNKIYNHT